MSIGIAALFYFNPLRSSRTISNVVRSVPIRLYLPLITGIVAFSAANALGDSISTGYFIVGKIFDVFMTKGIGIFILSLFYGYGMLIPVIVSFRKEAMSLLSNNQHLAVFFVAIMALAMIGGDDNERFFMWAIPVIYFVAGNIISRNRIFFLRLPLFCAILLGAQMISQRVFWLTPDFSLYSEHVIPLLFTPWSSNFQFFDLIAHWGVVQYGGKLTHSVALVQYLLVTLLVCFVIAYKLEKFEFARNPHKAN